VTVSPFSHKVRLLLCGNCAGPLPAPNEGGIATCEFCDTKSVLDPREEIPITPAERPPITEQDRLLKLRGQDGKNVTPPSELPFALMVWHGEDNPKRAKLGIEWWKKTIAGIKEGGSDADKHERVIYWLTLTFTNYYGSRKEWDRLRGMLETSVEVCRVPANLQVLRCYLARFAARMGDFEAAHEWLAACDPRSEDLRMDSAWRYSNALIAQYQSQFSRVLELLGKKFDEVPIAQELDFTVSMVRANALERMDDLEGAKQVLRDTLASTRGQPRLLKEIAEQSHTKLCPQAWPVVYAEAQRGWVIRYWVMTAVWLGAANYFALDWILGEDGDGWSIGLGWLVIPVLAVGWVLRARWRP